MNELVLAVALGGLGCAIVAAIAVCSRRPKLYLCRECREIKAREDLVAVIEQMGEGPSGKK